MPEEFRPSLSLLLSENPVEFDPRKGVITPLSAGESWLASFGLAARFNMICKKIRLAGEDGLTEEIYSPLFEHIDQYRQRSISIAQELSPLSEEPLEPRSEAAHRIAMLMEGQRLHKNKKGSWPNNPFEQEEALEAYKQLMRADDDDFAAKKFWAYQRARDNDIYWRRELQRQRGHRLAGLLRGAGVIAATAGPEV
jgi:hypothetical protein